MFAGHVGAAMVIARAERRINVGAFILAALLLDVALWLFVLLGWESVTIPADFADTHQPEFVFPYTHGLLASIGWAALAGGATFVWYPRLDKARARAALLVAAAVFSHWLLDALVHAPELPVAGVGSITLGIGLWHIMPVAVTVEAFISVAGLCAFLFGSTLSRASRLRLAALSLVVLAFTVAGMTIAPPPPSAAAMAVSSLVTIAGVCVLAFRFGRRPPEGRA